MNNYYFSYLMQEHGKENVNQLISNVLNDGKIEGKIASFNLNDWNFIYFFSVYFCTTLKHFGLNCKQIDLCLDTVIAPGWSNMYNSEKIFEIQKKNIPEIEKLIDKEFKAHHC